jgi:hypothetical protein
MIDGESIAALTPVLIKLRAKARSVEAQIEPHKQDNAVCPPDDLAAVQSAAEQIRNAKPSNRIEVRTKAKAAIARLVSKIVVYFHKDNSATVAIHFRLGGTVTSLGRLFTIRGKRAYLGDKVPVGEFCADLRRSALEVYPELAIPPDQRTPQQREPGRR